MTPTLFPPARDDDELTARREMVRQGLCPICGAGAFKSILMHVSQKHGIKPREMRELCGLTYTETVCDEELSRVRRETYRPLDPSKARRGAAPLSPEARRRAGEQIAQWTADNPEKHRQHMREASKKGKEVLWGHLPPKLCKDCRAELPRVGHARAWVRCEGCRARWRQRRERVLELWAQGKTDREIGEALGISRKKAYEFRRRAQSSTKGG